MTGFRSSGAHAAPIVSLPRVFGQQSATIFEPASLLPLLVRKPGTWTNSPVRDHVPDPVADWLDQASSPQRRQVLAGLQAATTSAGFDNAIAAAEALIRQGTQPQSDAIGMLARRLAAGTEPSSPAVNLRVYDGLAHTADTHAIHTGEQSA